MAQKEPTEVGLVVHDPVAAELILGGRGALYPGDEAQYWREAHTREPYFEEGRVFEDYGPAYELGWTGYAAYGGEFDTADRVLANDWLVQKGVSTLSWEQARPACRAAWQRAHNANSYTSDGSAPDQVVVDTLRDLAANARDGELGFGEAATHTETLSLRQFLTRCAQGCHADCVELHDRLGQLGVQADESGSVTAAAHRVWLQLRGLFGGASDETLLAECERGTDGALSRYREALRKNLPPDIHAMVLRQFEAAQRQRDAIKALREKVSATPEAGLSQRG